MTTYVLQAEDLCKSYGGRLVADHIGFSIHQGECYGLLGHNGAGKSTVLECILQVKKADEGTVKLFGKNMQDQGRELYKKIGVQFQESGYPDKMKVKEACELISAMYEKTLGWELMLKEFHLDVFQNQYIKELSGGERQRLSVLLAMLPNPQILFLDELTTGLDAQARREIWHDILAYKQNGGSVLLTSHYMDEVAYLCDRIGILKHGVMIFTGTPEEAMKKCGSASLEDAYIKILEEEW